MTIHATAPRTRRALLAGGLGGLVALAAHALGRPAATLAADGQAIVVGGEYTSSSVTAVTNATTDGLKGASSASGVGVTGSSSSGAGMYASSNTGIGVHGFSNLGIAVLGDNDADDSAAVVGRSFVGATGVLGSADNAPIPAAKPRTGVYGHATFDSTSRGVWGYTTAGQGVRGEATTGIGVRAYSASGPAGSFETATGYAIQAKGRLKLHEATGVATVASGTKSVVVTPGPDVSVGSFVLATLNGSAGGTTTVHRVAIDPTANTFTIYLTANATASVKVAWIILG